ncbi:hypothetical protein Y032_0272g933 [Ancylostoma ceylanicum]|uniref:SCP domain-containing protein n=1 Tax=Ancylostoma ceylanicum TaxID=53326 RepID=A0A016S998_9BILA|nr:hypothetical protein Y032_0272g933 [Ancylostoma ceylanicum]
MEQIRQEWDCNIEVIAHEALTNCTALPESGIDVNGVGLDFRLGTISTRKEFDVLAESKKLLTKWYNEVKQNDIPPGLSYKPAYHNFCAIVRDDARGMACTYTTVCGDGTKMLCVYSAPAKIEEPTPGRAMNIEEIGNYNMPLQDALELAITTWWRQVETEGIPADLMYTGAMASEGKITKFVNMASENIDSVGCAVTRCKEIGKIRVVCEYNTVPGKDEVVYTKATKKPCSGCTQIKKTCGTHYSEGLCV